MCRRTSLWHIAGILGISAASCGHDGKVAVTPAAPSADALPLVPRPNVVRTCAGALAVGRVAGDPAIAAALAAWLGTTRADDGNIVLSLEGDDASESYVLDVDARRAIVRAHGRAGLFYGAQTIAKLAGARSIAGGPPLAAHAIPCVHVEDAPRFAYRGMHLDVARHFFAKDVVLRYVDLLAFYKLNVFHWHLTDDQGFRLRLPSHPELATQPAYTPEEVREVVEYARARFVTVIPEIEMPGHARAILASHPELSCNGTPLPLPSTWGVFEDVLCPGNPATLALVDDVLGDVTALFPSRVVHIGGDEVPTTRWSTCPKCNARMKAEALTPSQLEGAFLRDVAARLAKRGRRTAVWDDALDSGMPDDAIVFAWRDAQRGAAAARAGHDVVMTPQEWVYFDRRQSRSSSEPGPYGVVGWDRLRAFDPSGPRVLGGEGALWTEYVTTPADVERRLLPRLAVLSDVLWSRTDGFASRFAAERPMLDAAHVGYFVDPPEIPARKVFVTNAAVDVRGSPLFPDGLVRVSIDGAEPRAITGPLAIDATTELAARLHLPDGRASDVAHAHFEKQSLSPARTLAPQEFVDYKYYEGDFHRLPDFAALVPKATGKMPGFGFDASFRSNGFAVLYESVFQAPADGVYTCTASADDGVRVTIDERVVVDDDGEHAPRHVSGEVALAAGAHNFRIAYFQSGGGKFLAIKCER